MNHAQKALGLLTFVSREPLPPENAQVYTQSTITHATLAVAEQLRIANLIALAGLPALAGFENETYDARLEALMAGLLDRREAPAVPGYGPAGIDEHTFIRPEIAEALGIETTKESIK